MGFGPPIPGLGQRAFGAVRDVGSHLSDLLASAVPAEHWFNERFDCDRACCVFQWNVSWQCPVQTVQRQRPTDIEDLCMR